ncbi:MAG: MOSC domain-containing protein [Gammaproteobacteria bacterium]|nr:MAG: MOSC domain-containing protein [Gammaproteobacteria bacterium]
MSHAVLHRICIFPIKSLEGVTVDSATVTEGGTLAWDRWLRMVDADGRVINGKRTAAVHRIRVRYDLEEGRVDLAHQGESTWESFALEAEDPGLAAWLGEALEMPVMLQHDARHGFPDDLVRSGPTVIGTATLEMMAEWFPGLDLDQLRRRFRANLEIRGLPPFGEELLGLPPDAGRPFRIGDVALTGLKPCRRCVVPTRDPETGEQWRGFQKVLVNQRRAHHPGWLPREHYPHHYLLALNTRIVPGQAGRRLRVGDPLQVDPG